MKLSEMNTVQMCRALARMAPPLKVLAEDDEITGAIAELGADMQGKNGEKKIAAVAAEAIARIFPVLLETHQQETLTIVSALTAKDPEEIAAQKGLDTIRDVIESVDKDFLDFIKSSAASK